MRRKRWLAAILAAGTACTALFGCGSRQIVGTEMARPGESSEKELQAWEEAKNTPYGKYPELITYTLGKMTGGNRSNMPERDTYEDNVYTRYLRECLNIQNKDVFEAMEDQYTVNVDMAIASGELPDVMVIEDRETLIRLAEGGMIADLSEALENCASDGIKAMYDSYEVSALDSAMIDGRLMALPEPSFVDGPNLLWLRRDWMDELGLEAPDTMEEAVEIVRAFVEQDPGNNGEGNTIGLVCHSDLTGETGYRYEFQLNTLFASYSAFPKQWILQEDGTVVYGSVQPQVKEALAEVRKLYEEKLLDDSFMLRTMANIAELIDPEILVRNDSSEPLLAGKVGIFFGPWWCGYTVGDATLAQEADWQAYFTPLAEDGKFYTHMAEPTTKYVVASKECKNPEAAFKIINYLIEYEQGWVDSGATSGLSTSDLYPLYNVYDNANEIEVSYDCLKKYLAGEIGIDDVDYSTHKLLKSDMEAITKLKKEPYDDFSLEYWNFEDEDLAKTNLPRLVSIMVGDAPLVNEEYVPIYNSYDGRTKTMDSKWANLKKLEEETFAKIITGKVGIDAFDSFVEEWKASGGDEITKEVQEELDAQQ